LHSHIFKVYFSIKRTVLSLSNSDDVLLFIYCIYIDYLTSAYLGIF